MLLNPKDFTTNKTGSQVDQSEKEKKKKRVLKNRTLDDPRLSGELTLSKSPSVEEDDQEEEEDSRSWTGKMLDSFCPASVSPLV
ncbi:hypothetical protein RRG08_038735 [Elysia crispata]|uniref:Uncharacterized protein n=1 Tax=Elysia crispata TaxID=231223 RepID=A0AAE1DNX6_9GAST|nr:hypothetical protein RRG08_038735 [Elysia crispata]